MFLRLVLLIAGTIATSTSSTPRQILGGAPLTTPQPLCVHKACPLGCSARGKCKTNTQTPPICLCNAGYIGTGCQQAHYQGYALQFNGKQAVTLPPMGTSKSLTVSFWLRLTALPKANENAIIYRSTKTDEKGTVIVSINSQGRLALTIHGNKPNTAYFSNVKHNPISLYEWKHIGITYAKRHAGRTGTGSSKYSKRRCSSCNYR